MIVVSIIGMLAAIALPNFLRARERSREKVCINNLRQVDGAKDEFAVETGLGNGSAIPGGINDLMPYLAKSEPKCPVGDTAYTLNVVGQVPECAAPGFAAVHNAAYQ
jgi:type II secretory pathway pseudopilin PulG